MTVMLTVYVLMWPVLVAGVLFAIVRGFAKDLVRSRKAGRPII